jgi:hypothetical protein
MRVALRLGVGEGEAGSALQLLAPRAEVLPGGQGAQYEAPSTGAYCPGSQGLQALAPRALALLPGAQGAQGASAPFAALAVPSEQGRHTEPAVGA